VIYARAFYDLQLRFADRVTTLTGLPRARALLEYSNLYIRFGLGRDFAAEHPVWRAYVAGLERADDPGDWTYRFVQSRRDVSGGPPLIATFGCFAYAQPRPGRVRLHFENADADGQRALGRERQPQRVAELAALFDHVKRALPQPVQVVGASWLYNLEAYRRLFPAAYLATARVLTGRFQHMPLWGQFLDRHGQVKPGPLRQFLDRLERELDPGHLDACFPLQVLTVEASAQAFYDLYGV
jgi:hypothetical protein